MSAHVFTLGEALAVFLAEDSPSPRTAGRYRRIVSGSEVNVAAGLVRLGHPTTLLAPLGDDALGDALASELRALGIDACSPRLPRPTGVLVRGRNGEGATHLRANSAMTAVGPDDVDEAWPTAPIGAVFVTGITAVRSPSARAAVERTVALGRDAGALVVVDANHRAALGLAADFVAALGGVRGSIDVAVGDAAELAMIAGTDATDPIAALHAQGCRFVIEKLGAAGVRASDGIRTLELSSAAESVVDTVGAGDAFAAGLLSGLLDGETLDVALARGTEVAARVVETAGDIDGLPSRSELQQAGATVHHG